MDDDILKIRDYILSSIRIKEKIHSSNLLIEEIFKISELLVKTFESNGKVLFCGNGGSAADAQHLSAELTGRFRIDRKPLFSEALHVNTSYLTAVANDYSYDEVYSRLVEAKCVSGDVLISISTSGNSKNILKAIEMANSIDVKTIGFTGVSGGKMLNICDYLIKVPSDETSLIQESHIMIGHIICDFVEKALFVKANER